MTSQTILRAEQLICGYGRKAVIGPLDLTIARGSLTAIIGPNGAGKSTCFKTLTGALPPLSGKVSLLDKPLAHYTLRERARLVSMVNQQITPQPLRVYDYVLMGRLPYFKRFQIGYSEEDHARCTHYIERTGIARLADKRLDELSGGEQQMVAIAQALTQEPQLLLVAEGRADEAQAVFKRAECVLPVLLRRCSGAFGQKPHRVKCLRVRSRGKRGV